MQKLFLNFTEQLRTMTDFKQTYSERLKALAVYVTPQDKKDITQETRISRPTMDKYLAGEVTKIDMAARLFRLFSAKINRRIKDLESAA